MTKTPLGIDVSQQQLDVIVSQEAGLWHEPHDAAGIA